MAKIRAFTLVVMSSIGFLSSLAQGQMLNLVNVRMNYCTEGRFLMNCYSLENADSSVALQPGVRYLKRFENGEEKMTPNEVVFAVSVERVDVFQKAVLVAGKDGNVSLGFIAQPLEDGSCPRVFTGNAYPSTYYLFSSETSLPVTVGGDPNLQTRSVKFTLRPQNVMTADELTVAHLEGCALGNQGY